MARRRGPGGGRKPRGPYRGNSKMLGVRVRRDVWEALDKIAKSRDYSLSQEVQIGLKCWIRLRRGPCGPALVDAISKVVERVSAATEKSFTDDSFTAKAMRAALDMVIEHFSAPSDGPDVIPPKVTRHVKEAIAKGRMPANVLEWACSPATVGQREAGFVIAAIEGAASEETVPPGLDPRALDAEGYWEIRRDLGSGWKRRKDWEIRRGVGSGSKRRKET
jgi:hypothetical protein